MASKPRAGAAVAEVVELLVVGGQRFCVRGTLDEVEARILEAARGSILELVRLTEEGSEDSLALNPAHIVALRIANPARSDLH
jgi:hypothetical protein